MTEGFHSIATGVQELPGTRPDFFTGWAWHGSASVSEEMRGCGYGMYIVCVCVCRLAVSKKRVQVWV